MQRCDACRTSNTACDLRRPRCSACTSRSSACVYRPTRDDYTFVNQNEVAARASQRAAQRRSRAPRLTIALDSSLLSSGSVTPIEAGPAAQVPASPLYSLDDRVVNRFISRWNIGHTCLNCIEFMPRLHEASDLDSPIRSSVLATAYADLAVSERHGDYVFKSHRTYLKTLRLLQARLAAPDFLPNDSLFAAILVVDAFELTYMGRPPAEGPHAQAIVRILELRKDHAYEDPQSFTLSRAAYHRIQVRQLLSGRPSLACDKLDYLNIENNSRINTYTVKFANDACDAVADLEIERSKLAGDVDQDKIMSLCATLRNLIQGSHDWLDNASNLPQPKQVALHLPHDSEMRQPFPRPSTIVHETTWVAREWLLFHICCIKMLNLLLDVRTQDVSQPRERTPEGMRAFLLDAQQDLTALTVECRSALDTIPFLIGLVDSIGNYTASSSPFDDLGLLTVKHPLWTIAESEYVPPDMKSEAALILKTFEAHRNIAERFVP